MLGILLVLTVALVTGSVLLVGYVAAAASFLMIIGLLLRKTRVRCRQSTRQAHGHSMWMTVRRHDDLIGGGGG